MIPVLLVNSSGFDRGLSIIGGRGSKGNRPVIVAISGPANPEPNPTELDLNSVLDVNGG